MGAEDEGGWERDQEWLKERRVGFGQGKLEWGEGGGEGRMEVV